MSFAAEPYPQFVDNLLRGLTGGVVRRIGMRSSSITRRVLPLITVCFCLAL